MAWISKPTKSRLRGARRPVVAILCVLLLVLLWNTFRLIPSTRADGTWIIQDETVVIADDTLTHQGNIIVRGTGQLVLRNSTLTFLQRLSWQFYIKVEDSAVMTLNHSRLQTVYPFKLVVSDSGSLFADGSSAPLIALDINSIATSNCTNSTFLTISATNTATVNLHTCHAERTSAMGNARLALDSSSVGTLLSQGDSRVSVDSSGFDVAQFESHKAAVLTDCQVAVLWCWFSANVSIDDSALGVLEYHDQALLSVRNCTVEQLNAVGSSPVTLDGLTVPKSKVMGWSNVSMLACTVDTIDCSWHSSLRFMNSSANRINAGDWAHVVILGASSRKCNVTNYGAYADTESIISWATFRNVELGHRTQTWMNDSTAFGLYNWAYGDRSRIWMSRCAIQWELRLAWGVDAAVVNTSVGDGCILYGDSSLNASLCNFGYAGIGENRQARLLNCRMSWLFPGRNAQIVLMNCQTNVSIRPERGTVHALDSLPLGLLQFWNSYQSGAIQSCPWNLTVLDGNITGWDTLLGYDDHVTVSNSTLIRIGCSGTSQVTVVNVTLGGLELYENSYVTFINGTIDYLQPRGSSVSEFRSSSIAQILSIEYAAASFRNCTIDYSQVFSRSPSFPSFLYENCSIQTHHSGDVGTAAIDRSHVETYVAADGSINRWTSSTIDLGVCGHHACLEISNCTIAAAFWSDPSLVWCSNCSFGNVTTFYQSTSTYYDVRIDRLDCYWTSVLVLRGNITGLVSCLIHDQARVIREMETSVVDQNGTPVGGALVEVLAPNQTLLIQTFTNPDGRCLFNLTFMAANASLGDTYILRVSSGAAQSMVPFTVRDPIPISVILNLAGVPFPPVDSEYEPNPPAMTSGNQVAAQEALLIGVSIRNATSVCEACLEVSGEIERGTETRSSPVIQCLLAIAEGLRLIPVSVVVSAVTQKCRARLRRIAKSTEAPVEEL